MRDSTRLARIALAYLPIPLLGARLTYYYRVGAKPGGSPHEVYLRGSPLAPPLFLPLVLLAASNAARRDGRAGRLGAGLVGAVGTAFLLGSTLNLGNDLAAAQAAGVPPAYTKGLAVVHGLLGTLLVTEAVRRIRSQSVARSSSS